LTLVDVINIFIEINGYILLKIIEINGYILLKKDCCFDNYFK